MSDGTIGDGGAAEPRPSPVVEPAEVVEQPSTELVARHVAPPATSRRSSSRRSSRELLRRLGNRLPQLAAHRAMVAAVPAATVAAGLAVRLVVDRLRDGETPTAESRPDVPVPLVVIEYVVQHRIVVSSTG